MQDNDPKPKDGGGEQNGESPAPNPTFKEKWKDPQYRKKFRFSMFMGMAFLSLGLFSGQHGATFLDLQQVTNTDLESSSAYFAGGSVGSIIGAILTGLIYDKLHKSFPLFGILILLALTNISIPYCRWFELMIFIRFVTSFITAGLKTECHAEHLRIWKSKGNGLMHVLHFSFSFGALISPLIAEPFLSEKAAKPTAATNETLSLNSTTSAPAKPSETHVHYVYLIVGIIILLTSIPFLVLFVARHCKKNRDDEPPQEDEPTVIVVKPAADQREIPTHILVLMLAIVGVFFFMYCSVEFTFFSYVMTFLVREYDSVSKSQGAYTTSVAWAAFAVARFLMIFLTRWFSPFRLLVIMTTIMAFAFVGFTVLAYYAIVDALIFFSAVAAIGMSGVYPSGFTWIQDEMFQVTGVVASYIMIVGSVGSIINPLVIGYLMDEVDNMWFCYLLLIQTMGMYAMLIASIVFTRCYVERKYGKKVKSPGNDDKQNKEQPLEEKKTEEETEQ